MCDGTEFAKSTLLRVDDRIGHEADGEAHRGSRNAVTSSEV
jgi:hypothetical protein